MSETLRSGGQIRLCFLSSSCESFLFSFLFPFAFRGPTSRGAEVIHPAHAQPVQTTSTKRVLAVTIILTPPFPSSALFPFLFFSHLFLLFLFFFCFFFFFFSFSSPFSSGCRLEFPKANVRVALIGGVRSGPGNSLLPSFFSLFSAIFFFFFFFSRGPTRPTVKRV